MNQRDPLTRPEPSVCLQLVNTRYYTNIRCRYRALLDCDTLQLYYGDFQFL